MTVDSLISERVLALRLARGLSLAGLAELSDVSKAMISKIERGESSPSATILGRLAAALGVSLAQLLTEEDAPPHRLRRAAEQELWRDPEVGYTRRQVCRHDPRTGIEIVEVDMPRSAQVSYPRWNGKPYRQRLWLIEGGLRVDYGDERFELAQGDSLDFGVDRPLSFKALGRQGCRYLLVTSIT
jgi:transcriptional regulator with XRE-family HTH domain